MAGGYKFAFEPTASEQVIAFSTMSVPVVDPPPSLVRQHPPIDVKDDVVLRFGMMEGTARVDAKRCVYDPQSAFAAEPFGRNGSRAKHLAVVANRAEVRSLGGQPEPVESAKRLLLEGAEVVVIKSGVDGAHVVENGGVTHVPAYRSDRSWTLGSGDVFAAIFAAAWGLAGKSPVEAARLASRAVAEYASTMALPIPSLTRLESSTAQEALPNRGQVYLAGPFFTISQRWLVDEARRCLRELGMAVFSPVHDVGHGPSGAIAQADLEALDNSDVVFAILDGLDSGTLFEVGHARARGKPVYALSQAVSDEDLKMVEGSGCLVFDDFVTALHRAVWRI